jgi:voltage-gated potassium channel Kch
MRRLLYIALGATAGVFVMRKLSRTAQKFTPAGLTDALHDLADAARDFAAEVRYGMAMREDELREALGVDDTNAREGRT